METKTKTLSINRMHMMLDEDACSLDLDYEASNDGFCRITIGSIGFLVFVSMSSPIRLGLF